MLDLELLKTLVCVVDEGSFTRAASRVHRTQSTVSQQVRKLEQSVGKTLLLRDRAGGNVSATEDGEVMLAYARRLLAIAGEAEHVLSAPRSARVIRLGVPEDFDVTRLTVLLAEFAARHAQVRLETLSGMSTDLLAGLAAGEFDLALVKRDPGEGPCLAAWPERLVWVGGQARNQAAAVVPLVLFPQGCVYRKRMIYALFTDLVGLLCRELALRFMPLEGLFLAGSVGRSIADRMDLFKKSFLAEPYMRHIPENTPIFLIRDDMAALHGCLAAMS